MKAPHRTKQNKRTMLAEILADSSVSSTPISSVAVWAWHKGRLESAGSRNIKAGASHTTWNSSSFHPEDSRLWIPGLALYPKQTHTQGFQPCNPESGPAFEMLSTPQHKTAFIIFAVTARPSFKSYWFLFSFSLPHKGRAFCKWLARFRPTKGTFIENPPNLILLKFDYMDWKRERKRRK